MKLFSKTFGLFWGGLFLLAFVISLILFFLVPLQRNRRVLFFPGSVTTNLSGEVRYLVHSSDPEKEIATVLEELILGPVSIHHLRAFPKDTKVRSLLYRDRILYLDFGYEIMFEESEVPLSVEEIVEAARKTVFYNFPGVKEIVITVNGQLPGEPYFEHELKEESSLQ